MMEQFFLIHLISFVAMIFGQVLWLIGTVFVFLTFIFGATALECDYGGICLIKHQRSNYTVNETKTCSDSCVYFKCHVGDYKFMEGAGCFEDFVNTCKYVDPQLLKEIKSSYQDYSIYNHSLVLASCNRRDGCAKEMFEKMILNIFLQRDLDLCNISMPFVPYVPYDECAKKKYDLKMPFGHRHHDSLFEFQPFYADSDYCGTVDSNFYDRPQTCEYDNAPKTTLSKVKCETNGWCESGRFFRYNSLCREVGLSVRIEESYVPSNVTKTCDACSKFLCTYDGIEIISGHGCFEDFEQMCGVVLNETIKNEISTNRKNYFYSDANIYMVTCSDSDNCHFDAFRKYYDVNFGVFTNNQPLVLQRRYYGECDYKPIVIPPPTTTTMESTTTTTKTTSSSSTTTTTTATIATTELVSFESISQQKDEEKDINNLSVSVYSSFYLMFLIIVVAFL